MEKIHNSTKDKILKLLLSNKEKEFTIRAETGAQLVVNVVVFYFLI